MNMRCVPFHMFVTPHVKGIASGNRVELPLASVTVISHLARRLTQLAAAFPPLICSGLSTDPRMLATHLAVE
jgi:hypothetical protein